MNDLISRKALLAEYDRVHVGPPGGARKLIENAPRVDAMDLPHWATERSYKNGYEAGKKDAVKWIPVSERLPEEWVDVLVWSKYGFCEVAVYLGIPGKWRITWNHDLFGVDSITHWMPLPEPPKGEE